MSHTTNHTIAVGGGNKALLRFDMGLLPAGLRADQVVKATLVFHVNRIVAAGPLWVSQLFGRFEEMRAMASNAPFSSGAIPMTPVLGVNALDLAFVVQNWARQYRLTAGRTRPRVLGRSDGRGGPGVGESCVHDDGGGATDDTLPTVWTGMTVGGGSAANDCSGWTSSSMSVLANYSTTSGPHGSLGGCGNSMRLVCVEQ